MCQVNTIWNMDMRQTQSRVFKVKVRMGIYLLLTNMYTKTTVVISSSFRVLVYILCCIHLRDIYCTVKAGKRLIISDNGISSLWTCDFPQQKQNPCSGFIIWMFISLENPLMTVKAQFLESLKTEQLCFYRQNQRHFETLLLSSVTQLKWLDTTQHYCFLWS